MCEFCMGGRCLVCPECFCVDSGAGCKCYALGELTMGFGLDELPYDPDFDGMDDGDDYES